MSCLLRQPSPVFGFARRRLILLSHACQYWSVLQAAAATEKSFKRARRRPRGGHQLRQPMKVAQQTSKQVGQVSKPYSHPNMRKRCKRLVTHVGCPRSIISCQTCHDVHAKTAQTRWGSGQANRGVHKSPEGSAVDVCQRPPTRPGVATLL